MFIVYTLPRCVQCTAVKRRLTKAGVEFVEADLSTPDYAERADAFRAEGIMQAPITVRVTAEGVETGRVLGYIPAELDALIEPEEVAA